LQLPALKYWRKRRGISQAELARRAGLRNEYVFRVENGRRGCNPETARLFADLLEIELQTLRRKPDDALDAKPLPEPASPRISYLHVHQEYLRIILEGAVGSAYAAMGEREVERRCERGEGPGLGPRPRDCMGLRPLHGVAFPAPVGPDGFRSSEQAVTNGRIHRFRSSGKPAPTRRLPTRARETAHRVSGRS
jgi:transcriptional regulator with XRE-family HTH domain